MKTYQTPRKGDVVLVCPPNTPLFAAALRRRFLSPGLCPGGTGYLIKRLAATGGDRVRITAHGVSVNGEPLPGSVRQDFGLDSVDEVERILAPDEVLLMTSHPRSFDGRYFGPLSRSSIRTTLRPVRVEE